MKINIHEGGITAVKVSVKAKVIKSRQVIPGTELRVVT